MQRKEVKKIIGIGNALVDVMTLIDDESILTECELPKGSMTLIWDDAVMQKITNTQALQREIRAGGSAANTINGLANLGVPTSFIGTIGNDEFGRLFKKDMLKNAILPQLEAREMATGRSIAFITPDAERTFGTYLGAAIDLSAKDITHDKFHGYHLMHIEGYLVQNHDLITKAAQVAKENNLLISLDLASYNVVESNLEFLTNYVKEYVDIVFANEEEAKAFTGQEPEAALNIIKEMCQIAVVKTGAKGSMVKDDKQVYQIPIIDVKCIDTTGAGDFYAAGFLFGYINGMSLDKCGNIGAILSGKVIEEIGAKISVSNWVEVKKRVAAI